MFSISYNLNKDTSATVVFTDDNFSFENQSNFFSKDDLKQINLFKKDIGRANFVKFDLIQNNKKKKILLYKLKKTDLEFDYQKAGGVIFKELETCRDVNILTESSLIIKKNNFLFCSNFFLGFFSRSYNFANYKLKKNDKNILLKSLSIVTSSKDKVKKAIN